MQSMYTRTAHTQSSLTGTAYVVMGPENRLWKVGRFKVEQASGAYCAEATAFTEALNYLVATRSAGLVNIYSDCTRTLRCPRKLTGRRGVFECGEVWTAAPR